MSKVFIEESTLTSIGNAIREKNGTTDMIAPLDMATAITNIVSGGGTLKYDIAKFTSYGKSFTLNVSSIVGTDDTKPFILVFGASGSNNSTLQYRQLIVCYYDGTKMNYEREVDFNSFITGIITNSYNVNITDITISGGVITFNFSNNVYPCYLRQSEGAVIIYTE